MNTQINDDLVYCKKSLKLKVYPGRPLRLMPNFLTESAELISI